MGEQEVRQGVWKMGGADSNAPQASCGGDKGRRAMDAYVDLVPGVEDMGDSDGGGKTDTCD